MSDNPGPVLLSFPEVSMFQGDDSAVEVSEVAKEEPGLRYPRHLAPVRLAADWPSDGVPPALYVVADETAPPELDVWTLSPTPDACGWDTDTGCPGYGLPLAVAIELARRYNGECAFCHQPACNCERDE